MSELKAGVGLSRKWDAREAGREVAETALEKLEGEKPKFFLLFSTIHYEKYGGFQELLNGVWEVLPEGTPLIGGTILGFLNNLGCFTRGVTSLAVSYPNMDVATGYGKNSKGQPFKAVKDCTHPIKNKLERSNHKNKFLLNLISGPEMFNFPKMGYKKIIRSKSAIKMALSFMKLAQNKFQKGFPRDDEILEMLSENLKEYSILSGVLLDDFKFTRNYQFVDNRVETGAIVGLGLSTDLPVEVHTSHRMKTTGIEFKITEVDYNGWILKKFDGLPAKNRFLELLGWNEETILDEYRFLMRTMYYPIGIKKGDIICPTIVGMILGDWIVTTLRAKEGDDATVLNISGEEILEAVDENIQYVNRCIEMPLFGIHISCITRLITLGKEINAVRRKLLDFYNGRPFLVIYVAGEGTYTPKHGLTYSNMSFNSAVFGKSL